MKIIDRYILRQFVINYLILFAVMALLIVTIDLIVNLDEFLKAGQRFEGGGWARLWGTLVSIVDYYGPEMCVFYIYISGLLPVGAAGFTLAGLVRNRELTAMIAGGISLHRVAMPVLAAGVVANGLLLIDQELIIPQLSNKLARRQADMQYGYQKPFRVQFAADQRGALFTAALFDPRSDVMNDVTVIERDAQGLATRRITASAARWDDQVQGWHLSDGLADVRDPGQVAGSLQRQPVDFLATDLDPTALKLRRNASFRQLLSLGQLRELADKPLLVDTASVQRIIHSRFSLIVINLLMLMMVLPFYLLRVPANLLVQSIKAAPLCLGAWAGGFVILQVDLPGLPPAASAWLPVAIYMPTALVLMDRVES